MRKVLTLIFVGCISFTGMTAHAQILGDIFSTQSMFDSLQGGGIAPGTDLGNLMDTITGADTTIQQGPTLDESLLVISDPPSNINQTIADTIDTQTGRYRPRLKIVFTEFPLRSLESVERSNNPHNTAVKTGAEITIQRIQDRLRIPQLDLAVKDRTAIVSGTVETERQRSLVATMLRFEPGIDTVQNKLIVVPPQKD